LLEKAGFGVDDRPEVLGGDSVADALLAVHRSYLNDLRAIWAAAGRPSVHGLVHITGGGFYDNIPRVVPDGLCVEVDPTAWTPLPIFQLIADKGGVADSEMYRVFNMGIGMVVVTGPETDLTRIEGLEVREIGTVSEGAEKVRMPF
ncbi:MAG: AIR synthase-related protein, partial [Candidatus Krumholzibacteriota bacterium]